MIPKDDTRQLSLTFEKGLAQRYRDLSECVAAGVYRRGLTRVAGAMDVSPSHLSEKLSNPEPRGRQLTVRELEAYIESQGDLTPIYYLVARFCRDPDAQQREALARLASMVPELENLMRMAKGE